MKSSDLIRLLKKDGWYVYSQKGSHKKFKHSKKPGSVIVADHKGKEIPKGTLDAILKQAGMK